ncbi:hypothetical protein [Christiangramia forsetii]|uniref:Membrane protein n=2 Tax=Christiangramia forsetii TaxID=411153 RepID=A0M389_CHRFK|nr:hypothetical protein [Christiangramia forsetii]GGG26481.1 hypothetical protein GCM10011532_07350 [Christiangramia forsetii]CAL67084.1 membrane protein [Christiangramia forsetii KT0803]
MQEYFDFLITRKVYVTLLMELLAALAGSLYLYKKQRNEQLKKQFVWFLFSVFIIDLLGGYSIWAYFDDYQSFPFLKDSLFTRNFWWFNIARTYFIAAYCYFLRKRIANKQIAFYLKWALGIFIVYAIFNMVFSGQFFIRYITGTFTIGTFLVVTSVFAYFYDILISDRLVGFYGNLFFYIAVGVLLWYLVIPPIELYVNYFTEENQFFIEVFAAVLRYANIFMYSMFALGFYIDYRYRRNTENPLPKD